MASIQTQIESEIREGAFIVPAFTQHDAWAVASDKCGVRRRRAAGSGFTIRHWELPSGTGGLICKGSSIRIRIRIRIVQLQN